MRWKPGRGRRSCIAAAPAPRHGCVHRARDGGNKVRTPSAVLPKLLVRRARPENAQAQPEQLLERGKEKAKENKHYKARSPRGLAARELCAKAPSQTPTWSCGRPRLSLNCLLQAAFF